LVDEAKQIIGSGAGTQEGRTPLRRYVRPPKPSEDE